LTSLTPFGLSGEMRNWFAAARTIAADVAPLNCNCACFSSHRYAQAALSGPSLSGGRASLSQTFFCLAQLLL
jgi:hypothetical protein